MTNKKEKPRKIIFPGQTPVPTGNYPVYPIRRLAFYSWSALHPEYRGLHALQEVSEREDGIPNEWDPSAAVRAV
jgi:hypothetical protein